MSENRDDLDQILERSLQEVEAFYEELDGESDRAAAILAVAALEDQLETVLRKQFPRDITDKLWAKVAGSGGTPFGSMKAKADVLQAFGFYGPKTRTAIERISTVRNRFAHRRAVRTFDHPDIIEMCAELQNNPIAPYVFEEPPLRHKIRGHYIDIVRALTKRLAVFGYRDLEAYNLLGVPEPEPLP